MRQRLLITTLLILLAPPRMPAAPEMPERAGSIERRDDLRDLEKRAAAVIEAALPAFVFLEGGSGFVISEDGYVLTNAHVVADRAAAGRSDFRVHLTGGKALGADLVGRDPEGDVALLKLRSPPGVRPLGLGDSAALGVGDPVIALGDPFLLGSESIFFARSPPSYEPSASLGIVSALHRFSDTYTDAIQVDVAVNRGNSGGPLLTLEGKVVGINGKIETRFENAINSGVGYAIPAHQIARFLEPLKRAEGGIVRHGTILGLRLAERARGGPGLPVTRVGARSAAERAGFRAGDFILSIDGQSVPSQSRCQGLLGTYPAGHEVLVKLQRGSEVIDLKAPLIEAGPLPYIGLTTETTASEDGGVRIIEVLPSSPADRAGFKVKDVISVFNEKRVLTGNELELQLQAQSPGDFIGVTLLRGGVPIELKVHIGGRVKS